MDAYGREAGAGSGKERGIALILTLLILAILLVLVSQFAYSVKIDERLAQNSQADVKAFYGARGSVAFFAAYLRDDLAGTATTAGAGAGAAGSAGAGGQGKGEGRGGKVDSLREKWASDEVKQLTVGDVQIALEVEDAERRLNVNLLADETKKKEVERILKALAAKLAIEEPDQVVGRIVDYIDVDTEGEFEAGAKNGQLSAIEELFLIEGIKPEAFVGKAAEAGTTTTTTGLTATGTATTAAVSTGLYPYLTVWGRGTLNLNTMPEPLLWAMLPEKDAQERPVDRDAAVKAILEHRGDAARAEAAAAAAAGGTSPTGTTTGSSTSTSTSTSTTGEVPGNDFRSVDELKQIPGLDQVFPRQQGQGGGGPGGGGSAGGGAGGGGQAEPKAATLRDLLAVSSRDFVLEIQAKRGPITKGVRCVLRRANDIIDTVYWKEHQR